MSNDNDIQISYDKFYTDDIGKHVPELFSKYHVENVSIKSYWVGAIDAFISHDQTNFFSCMAGDIRIVVAYDQGNNNYKFTQYFLSGLDGKVVKIAAGLWYGIHNLSSNSSILICGYIPSQGEKIERLNKNIFNWHSKR